jgi:hypothetical protein
MITATQSQKIVTIETTGLLKSEDDALVRIARHVDDQPHIFVGKLLPDVRPAMATVTVCVQHLPPSIYVPLQQQPITVI